MSIFDRLKWLCIGRLVLKKNGSSAHWLTYVCKESVLYGRNKLAKGTVISTSSIGRFTYVAGAKIVLTEIGSFCSIGPNVRIGGLGSHPVHWISTHPAFYSTLMQCGTTFSKVDKFEEEKRTALGNDVWIGANATILDGVRIGHGAIVAAGAVVTKEVPPYGIVGGVPAKIIRYRFSADVIDALLEWQWWNLPEKALNLLADDFCMKPKFTISDIDQMRAKLAASSYF